MEKINYQQIIESYIQAYNNFDIDAMLKDMHENVRFENISNGKITLSTNGIEKLKAQAKEAIQYFKTREQRITMFQQHQHIVEIEIDYSAVLAIDLPNGLKTGDKLELKGKSVFMFEGNKIISLKDFS